MLEVELKFEIERKRIPSYINSLLKQGFSKTSERILEKTAMFDNQENLMQKTNGRLRLRLAGHNCELSYKRPIGSGKIKKEIEYEVSVSSCRVVRKILKEMGYHPTTFYERYRATFKNADTKIKVTLDEFPFATYLEIETDKDERKVWKLSQSLGLDRRDNLVEPCDTLFTQWRISRNLKPRPDLLFRTYDR